MSGKLWTAAGIYASWRLIVKPILRAGALLTRAAILLPLALVPRGQGTPRQQPVPGRRWDGTGRPASRWPTPKPVAQTPVAAPANSGTGDWRQDQETLRRLIKEGQIRTGR